MLPNFINTSYYDAQVDYYGKNDYTFRDILKYNEVQSWSFEVQSTMTFST